MKFREGLKDFFYDAIDYILMIVIILAVAGIIGWRLNILFHKEDTKDSTIGTKIEISKDDKKEEKNKVEDGNKNSEEENKVEDNEKSTVETVKVVIPSDSTGSGIANILYEKGLIEDKGQFLAKMSELKLDTKLKCGEFEIGKNNTLEEILNIITK